MIRPARRDDITAIMEIFETARIFMCRHGNPNQWIGGYPSSEIILNDIDKRNFFVEETDGLVSGCFAFIIGEEPTYSTIDGAWLDDHRYGTIHRLASDGSNKGLADRCVAFCLSKIRNLRADTHKDNHAMQRALKRNGFVFCGIIHVANGSERLAYQLNAQHLRSC